MDDKLKEEGLKEYQIMRKKLWITTAISLVGAFVGLLCMNIFVNDFPFLIFFILFTFGFLIYGGVNQNIFAYRTVKLGLSKNNPFQYSRKMIIFVVLGIALFLFIGQVLLK